MFMLVPMYAGKTSKLLQRVLWLNHKQKSIGKLNLLKMIATVKIQLQHTTQLSYPVLVLESSNEIEDNYNIMPTTMILYV